MNCFTLLCLHFEATTSWDSSKTFAAFNNNSEELWTWRRREFVFFSFWKNFFRVRKICLLVERSEMIQNTLGGISNFKVSIKKSMLSTVRECWWDRVRLIVCVLFNVSGLVIAGNAVPITLWLDRNIAWETFPILQKCMFVFVLLLIRQQLRPYWRFIILIILFASQTFIESNWIIHFDSTMPEPVSSHLVQTQAIALRFDFQSRFSVENVWKWNFTSWQIQTNTKMTSSCSWVSCWISDAVRERGDGWCVIQVHSKSINEIVEVDSMPRKQTADRTSPARTIRSVPGPLIGSHQAKSSMNESHDFMFHKRIGWSISCFESVDS